MFQKFTSGVKQLPFKKTGEGGSRAPPQKSTFKYGDPRGPGAATDKERKRRDSKTLLTHLSPGHKKGPKNCDFLDVHILSAKEEGIQNGVCTKRLEK